MDIPAWMSLLMTYFIHSSWTHLGANVLVLLALGWGLERAIGQARFGLMFLAGGLIGVFAEVMLHAASTKPLCGASIGAAAVWMAWLLHVRVSQRSLFTGAAA